VKRKRLLALVGLGWAVALVAGISLDLRAHRQKFARGLLIDRDHYGRIHEGMSRAEVEAVLGGPQGYYSADPVFSCVHGPPPTLGTGDRWETWIGDDGEINVVFDDKDEVRWRDFAPPTRPSSLDGWVRDWLRRVWP
jgi:hypothetical protein